MTHPRRVAGRLTVVGAVIALVVLGWAAPAFAVNPTISSFTPGSGPTGCIVTINGTFTLPVSAVSFGGTAATTFNDVSSSLIYAEVGAGSNGVISVTDAGGTGTSSSSFTVASPGTCAPSIASITPTSGPDTSGGCGVTILGSNLFSDVTPSVTINFNGTAATAFGSPTSTQVNTHVPSGATTGVVHAVTWTTANGPSFTVPGTNTCAPTIGSFAPTSGTPGTAVTITGTNLLDASSVKFNGVSATFQVNSTTSITAIVPGSATTGRISVTTTGPGAATVQSSSNFAVGGGVPTITSFTPTSGGVGTSVTITGTNFIGATKVTFNTTDQTTFTVNGTGTQITVAVPTGATTGKIKVTTPGGTATSANDFTVIPAPTITSFTPTSGPTGTSVSITGTNFSGTGFTTTSVTFNNVTSTFHVNSATSLSATVPSTATTGKIKVTTPGGSATSTGDFTVSTTHNRNVSLSLRKHLVAKGSVSASDGFSACVDSVTVLIQRRVSGHWKTIKTVTTASGGAYSARIADKEGTYRARAPKDILNGGVDICKRATSPTRTH